MSRSIGIGVIGMGWMGTVHSRSYRLVPDRFPDSGFRPRLVICADDVEARAVAAKNILGFEKSTTTWQQVIADKDVEVVNIAAPNGLHLEMVEAAASAGKHILCEKPVGRNRDETAKIENAARIAGVLTFVGYSYRWAPLVQYVRDLIQKGTLGQITHYRGRFLVGYARDPRGVLSWRFQRELAGLGALGDLMSHVADMAHMLVGPIERVSANQHTFIKQRPLAARGEGTHFSIGSGGPTGEVTNEDYASSLVKFKNAAQGVLEVCRVINGPKCGMAFDLYGTKGSFSWDFERMNEAKLYLPDGSAEHNGQVLIQSGPEHPYHAHFNPGPAISLSYEDLKVIEAFEFLRSVVQGKQGQPGFSDALAVANVLSTMIRSWESGQWQPVPTVGS